MWSTRRHWYGTPRNKNYQPKHLNVWILTLPSHRMNNANDPERKELTIHASVPSTASTTAKLAKKAPRNALDTLVTLSWQLPSSILVWHINGVPWVHDESHVLIFSPPPLGFLTKIKKLLETVCHNCGKIKANQVSRPSRDGKSCMAPCFADTEPRVIPSS